MLVRTLSAHVKPDTDVKRAQILLRNLGYLPKNHKSGLVYGLPTRKAVKKFKKDHNLPADGVLGEKAWIALERAYAKHTGHTLEKVVMARPLKLRERAFAQAGCLVGVMEVGGNNMGPTVTKIIRENGGTGPEPWCGDFVAYCYRHAGSKRVSRSWASVLFLGTVFGLVTTSKPKRGDIVRFNFSHTGLFDKWRPDLGAGWFQTIEGNTGPTGAVSDGDGGDGVYRKTRNMSQVSNFRRVLG